MTTTQNNKKMSISVQIIIGMLAGVGLAWLARVTGLADLNWFQQNISNGMLLVVGQLFIKSLKMLVVPLVFVSLVCGVCNLSDPAKLGRVGLKTLLLYLATTAIAISLAIWAAVWFEPGVGANFPSANFSPSDGKTMVETLIALVPDNPFKAMADGKMLQIIIFALLFGIAMAFTGEKAKPVTRLFNSLDSVIMRLVTILMHAAPYGVFALLAKLVLDTGLDKFDNLAKYFLLVLVMLLIHGLVVYPSLLVLLARMNPLTFMRKMRPVHLFAFSTASSNATLPVTLEVVTKRLGVHSTTASFTLPLGATINMDGTAIMQGVATVFIAQVYGHDLSMAQYLSVIVAATLASIGTAGVPGVGLITLAMVLKQVNLPTEAIGIILGIDRILDMVRTAVNVTGDAVVTCIVGRSENELDMKVYNDPEAGLEFENIP